MNGVNILNTIRANASDDYQKKVPVATDYNLQEVGNPILNYTAVANEFLSALVNRIALVVVQNRIFNNPLSPLKRGTIPLGQDVEEIFTNPANAVAYDMEASTELLARTPPDVKAAYHRMNRQDQFPVTISNQALRKAFVSWSELESLIASIINSLYSGDNIKEYNLMTNLYGTAVNSGFIRTVNVSNITSEQTAKDFVKAVKRTSGMIQFPSSDYNAYSLLAPTETPVVTWTPKDRQIFLVRSDVLADIDVDVLAYAFNMEKADFMGRVVEVGSFGNTAIAQNTLAILADEGWSQVYDNLQEMTEFYNAKTLSWNYYWNHWQTYSYSPFANAIAFVAGGAMTVTANPESGSTLTSATVNVPYNFQPTYSVNSAGVINYSKATGSTATWANVDANTGAISGTPTAIGTNQSINIDVKDSSNNTKTVNYTISVVAGE